MPHGRTGRVLRVDLSEGSSRIEVPEERVYRSCLGGSGLALHYLLNELKPKTDPLSPENLLVFAASALTGTPGPGSPLHRGREIPLTDGYGEARGRRVVGAGAQVRRLRRHRRDGPGPQTGLSVDQGWQGRAPRCGPHVGQNIGGRAGLILTAETDKRARVLQCGPAGERWSAYGQHRERAEARQRPDRHGRGDGHPRSSVAIAVRGHDRSLNPWTQEGSRLL